MRLLRLLTTGKSLVNLRNADSPYRLTTQRLLPQFGPTRNPFADTQGETKSAVTSVPQVTAHTGTVPLGAGIRRVRSVVQALWLKTSALWSGGKAKLSGLTARSRPAAFKPVIPHFSKPPMQGELSLDRVKVIRNDLSEADLEVVPARPKKTPDMLAAAPEGGKESALRWMAPQVVHAGKR